MNGAHRYKTFPTQNGFVALAWNDKCVTGLRLPAKTAEAAEASILRRLPGAHRTDRAAAMQALIVDIVRYFEGGHVDFSEIPVDLGVQDPFSADVYAEIRKLRWGETTTYGTVAKTLGALPQAARDVGQAMATNPVPLIVPCHRVLAAGNKIGGFSAPGGTALKTRMLEIEGVMLEQDPPARPAKTAPPQTAFDF